MNHAPAQPGTYDRWQRTLRYNRRGGEADAKGSTYAEAIVNEGPREMGELADLFVNLDDRALRAAFPALIADAHQHDPNFSTGALLRPLIVVAERLAHARIPEPVLLALQERHAMPDRPPLVPPPRTTAGPSAPAGDAAGVFTVCAGPPPARVRGRAPDELTLAMTRLRPDQYLRVKRGKLSWAQVQQRVKRARQLQGSPLLFAFTSAEGDIVIAIARSAAELPQPRGGRRRKNA